jgi:hypothetical protein
MEENERGATDELGAAERMVSLLSDDLIVGEQEEETQGTEQETDEVPESESDESEDADESDDDGEPEPEVDEDEEDDETEEEAPKTYKVKVGGEESEVTVDELVAGYQRQRDYTRKTMQIAEERKAAEAEAKAMREAREEYAGRVGELRTLLERASKAETPDWDRLERENLTEYARQWAKHQQRQQMLDAVKDEEARINEQRAAEQRTYFQQKIAEEQKMLLEAIPEWKKAEVRKSESEALLAFAESEFGLSKDEVAQFTDHRALVMLRMAMKYRQLQAKGKKIVKDKRSAPRLKPGKPEPKRSKISKRADRARKRLTNSGHPNDAQALFEEVLPDDF